MRSETITQYSAGQIRPHLSLPTTDNSMAMSHLTCLILFTTLAGILGTTAYALAAAQAENTLEVVIGNGPHAGTYNPPAENIICMHYKKEKRYFATWKDFDARDAKAIAEAGINVLNPDDPGAKHGEVRIAFGDPDKKPTVYSVYQAPLTLTLKGNGAEITFQGKTKDGIQLRVTAKCSDVETM